MIRLLISMLVFPFGLNAQDLHVEAIGLEGKVYFVFEMDTSSRSYYFVDNYVSANNRKYSLINSYSLAKNTLDLCGDINGMLEFAIAQRAQSYRLTDSPLFRSISKFNSGQHFGGEIYEVLDNENQLVIAFALSVFGIAVYSECPATKHPLLVKEKHCDFLRDKNDTTIFLITNIVNLFPFDQSSIDKSGLIKSSIKSFPVIYCE